MKPISLFTLSLSALLIGGCTSAVEHEDDGATTDNLEQGDNVEASLADKIKSSAAAKQELGIDHWKASLITNPKAYRKYNRDGAAIVGTGYLSKDSSKPKYE